MVRPGLAFALVLVWSGTARAYERARPMGLYPPGNAPALAMLDSRIEITVRGPIVETVVVQRFRNTGPRATEATYIFPLPVDAAVSAMAMRIGTRTLRAAIETREAAQRRYEAAITAGVAGALLEQERPDVFTQTVSAILPGAAVEVTLRYDTLARYEAGTWELVVPMVVAPRYVPGTASGRATTGSGRAPDTDRAPDASRVTPAGAPGAGGPTAIAIHFVDPPGELTSPTHELGGSHSDATLSDPHSDHDAIVRWRAPASSAGWVERDGDGGFAAIMVAAPAAPPRKAPLRVIFAIDRASTTRGDADAVEHPLVRALCGALEASDRVRAIDPTGEDPRPAGKAVGGPTPRGRASPTDSSALAWSAPGDALAALERAWATPAPVFDLTRVLAGARPEGAAIILVSDGLVADDRAAIAAAQRLGVPVHVIGIGPAPARATLQHIAAASGGTVRYAVAGDDVTALARSVLGDAASPAAPLSINWGTLGASDVEPAVLPRLGAGQAMLVLARVKRVQPAHARTRGELFAFEALAAPSAVDGATTARGALARRWARERLGDLIAARRDRATVVSHALAYGLVSPYTSLVAVGTDVVVSGGVRHSVAVPVSVPSGMNWQAVKQAIDLDTTGTATGALPEPASESPPASQDSSRREVSGRPSTAKTPPAAKVPPAAPKAPPAASPPARHRGPAKDNADDDADTDARLRKPARPAAAPPSAAPPPAAPPSAAPPSAAPPSAAPPPAAPSPTQVSAAEPEPALSDEELSKLAEQEATTEAITITGALIGRTDLGGSPRSLRLTAALGGGLAFDGGARGLGTLDVRVETNRRTAVGAEATLWLLSGAGTQGRVLLTVARGGLARWFEVGLGAGLHLGDGTGVAASARLHIATPLPLLGGYLRYDSAVLLTRPSLAVEHAVTLGLELSY